MTAPLVMRDGIRINHLLVRGHLFWTEDLSLLTDQYEDIKEQQEELKARNRLLQRDVSAGSQKTKSGRNRTGFESDPESDDRTAGIDDAFYGRAGSHRIQSSLRTSACPDDCDRNVSEARKNLLLTMNNDSQEGLTEEDLRQSLAESCSAFKTLSDSRCICQCPSAYFA